MKKCVVSLAAALVVLCSLTIFASAAQPDPGVTVQLDGQNLEFTDAQPQVKDNRIFLPFRAVFEAMGAEVGYEGDVVTAKRGDTALSMTIGDPAVTITRGSAVEELTMDVAPYVDNTTWRTYVPVRFAAEAFGCNVGWDQAAMTAVIVDVDTLVDQALAGKEFTVLEQYMEYSKKYNTGNWAVDGSLDASFSLMDSELFSILTGAVNGITSGDTAGEMSMTMDLDLTELMSYIAAAQGAALSDLGCTEEDLRQSMAMDAKVDMTDSAVFYFKMDDASNEAMGLPAGTWLSMDLNAYMASSGIEWDYDALMSMAGEIDMAGVLKAVWAVIPLDDQAADGYPVLSSVLNTVVTALSDDGFQKTDSGYLSCAALELEPLEIYMELALDTDASGAVNGSSIVWNLNIPFDEAAQAELAKQGLAADSFTLTAQAALDSDDNMTAEFGVTISPMFTFRMNMGLDYDPTDLIPDTSLPEGAAVVDYMALMSELVVPEQE